MAFGNTVAIVGNATHDPELRFTPSGVPVCTFGVAWNRRYERNGEQVEETSFFDIRCWQTLAENVASSIGRGARVVVVGRLEQRSWENQDGEKRTKLEITAEEVSPSLRWASVEITKNPRTGNGAGQQGGYQTSSYQRNSYQSSDAQTSGYQANSYQSSDYQAGQATETANAATQQYSDTDEEPF